MRRFWATFWGLHIIAVSYFFFEFDVQYYDEDGNRLFPPIVTVKDPFVQELERDQREALEKGDQLLESIKKEFKKD